MKKFGYVAVLFFVTIWSMQYVSSKILLEVLTPVSIVFIRYVFASVFFVVLMFKNKQNLKVEHKDTPLFISSALIGIVFYFAAELAGLERLTASAATLILALIPLVILIVNRITNTEELSNMKKISVVGSILGIALVVSGGSKGVNELLGYVFMLGAVVAWVVFSFQSTGLVHKYGETKVAAIQGYITLFSFLPFYLVENPDLTTLSFIHWFHLIFLGVISSGIASILYNFSLKTIGGTVTSLGINFVPVFTLFFGYIFLGETMSWVQVIGGVLIIVLMGFTIAEDIDVETNPNEET